MSPEMAEMLKLIASFLIPAFSVYIAYATLNRSKEESNRSEIEERVRRDARMDAKLDESIQLGRDTKESVSELRREIGTHNDRILRTEESLKSLNKRMDTVEKRLNAWNGGDTYE